MYIQLIKYLIFYATKKEVGLFIIWEIHFALYQTYSKVQKLNKQIFLTTIDREVIYISYFKNGKTFKKKIEMKLQFIIFRIICLFFNIVPVII